MFVSTIDFFTVADLDDKDDQFLVVDRINDPIVALADSIQIVFAGEFLDALRARVLTERFEPSDDALLNRFSQGFELAFGGRSEEN